MILGKAGTFFELDADTADWLPAEVSVDDEDITVAEPVSDGLFSGMVLALDDQGNNDLRAFDWWLGAPASGLFTSSGRWLGTDETLVPDEASEPALIQGTLTLDDEAPSGVRLEEATLVEATELSEDDPYGTQALGCSHPTSGPFDPNWLLEGRCTRTQIEGATVIAQGSPP